MDTSGSGWKPKLVINIYAEAQEDKKLRTILETVWPKYRFKKRSPIFSLSYVVAID